MSGSIHPLEHRARIGPGVVARKMGTGEEKRPGAISAGIVAGVFLLIVGLWQVGALQPAELFMYDQFVRWRSPNDDADPRITIIGVNEEDIRRFDYALTDEVLAQLIEVVGRHRPAVVGIDIFRDLPVPRSGEQSARLGAALLGHENVICSFRLGGENSAHSIPPPPALKDFPDRCGFTDFPYDHKTIRRALLYAGAGDAVHTSLAMQVALFYLEGQQLVPEPDPADSRLVRLGKATLPRFQKSDGAYTRADDRGYQVFLDFQGPATFRTLSLTDVLSGHHDPSDIAGRIVLIAMTARSIKDYLATPLRDEHPGIDLHGQVINQLLRTSIDGFPPVRVWPDVGEAAWLLGWCTLAGLSGFFLRSPWSLTLALAGGAALMLYASWLLFERGCWVPVAAPLGGGLGSAALVASYMSFSEWKLRRLVMTLFRRNVSIADAIWERRNEFLDGGRLRPVELTATILFSDLRGYSTLSETMKPSDLLDWLNPFQEAMAREVNKHGGIVISYSGDALMAAFGAPIKHTSEDDIRQDAINAVNCALAMRTALEGLNARWRQTGRKPASMRVGIHTGPAVAGSIGSAERLEFAVIGDTTNTAARLESLDREAGGPAETDVCRILIGHPTWRRVVECCHTEDLGEKELKGKVQLVRIHRVLGRKIPGQPLQPYEG